MIEIVFMTTVAGASILFGFGMTLALAKKRDPVYFAKGFLPSHTTVKTSKASSESELLESGSRLAVRALGWGTFYALSGFSLFSLAVWKLMAVQNVSPMLDFLQAIYALYLHCKQMYTRISWIIHVPYNFIVFVYSSHEYLVWQEVSLVQFIHEDSYACHPFLFVGIEY